MAYCQNCGKTISSFDSNKIYDKEGKLRLICNDCKKLMPDGNNPSYSPNALGSWNIPLDVKPPRPLGVTILAILDFIGGIVGIIVIWFLPYLYFSMSFLPTEIWAIIVTVGVTLSILQIVVGYGLLKGYSWAWTAEFILRIISGIGGILSILIAALILIYLTKPHVKAYFGKT